MLNVPLGVGSGISSRGKPGDRYCIKRPLLNGRCGVGFLFRDQRSATEHQQFHGSSDEFSGMDVFLAVYQTHIISYAS